MKQYFRILLSMSLSLFILWAGACITTISPIGRSCIAHADCHWGTNDFACILGQCTLGTGSREGSPSAEVRQEPRREARREKVASQEPRPDASYLDLTRPEPVPDATPQEPSSSFEKPPERVAPPELVVDTLQDIVPEMTSRELTPEVARREPVPEQRADVTAPCPYLLCENFENALTSGLDKQKWSLSTRGSAQASVVGNRTHRGKGAFYAKITKSGWQNFIQLKAKQLTPQTKVYGRAWLYVDKIAIDRYTTGLLETMGTAQSPQVYAGKPFATSLFVAYNQWQGKMFPTMLYDTPGYYNQAGPGSNCSLNSSRTTPLEGKWICLEWHHDSKLKRSVIWLDGKQFIAMGTTTHTCSKGGVDPNKKDILYPNSFSGFRFHFFLPREGLTTVHQFWLDDVAIHNQRIGCTN